jgi:MurNAc alpha-1-phosphate uridylyltransferase
MSEALMRAMILAAGRGERMRPLTDHTPKPLVHVAGKPLLQWHLEGLAQAGFRSVVINVAHLGSQIEEFVGDGSHWNLRVRFSREPEGALETAGGIAMAQPWINESAQAHTTNVQRAQDTPFLVINADIWTDWPRANAFEIALKLQSENTLAHIVLVDNPPHHPQGDFEFDGRGSPRPLTGPRDDNPVIASSPQASAAIHPEAVIASSPQASAAIHPEAVIASSPQASAAIHRALTFSGIGIYKPALFSGIKPGQRAALAPLLRQAMAAGQCTASHYRGKWSDIGTPERLNDINSALSEPK